MRGIDNAHVGGQLGLGVTADDYAVLDSNLGNGQPLGPISRSKLREHVLNVLR